MLTKYHQNVRWKTITTKQKLILIKYIIKLLNERNEKQEKFILNKYHWNDRWNTWTTRHIYVN